MATEPDVQRVAAELRAHYLHCRDRYLQLMQGGTFTPTADDDKLAACYDGGKDSRGHAHKGVWTKLARISLRYGLAPVAWVETLFSLMYMFANFPRPTDLENAEVIRQSHHWDERCAEDIYFRLTTEWRSVNMEFWNRQQFSALSPEREARAIVADPWLQISPLVRYAFAVDRGCLDLAHVLYEMAARQYRAAPQACDRALDKYLHGAAFVAAEAEGQVEHD